MPYTDFSVGFRGIVYEDWIIGKGNVGSAIGKGLSS